jgi:hypothetical protein
MVSDDDEGALLSEARPLRAKPRGAVAGDAKSVLDSSQQGLGFMLPAAPQAMANAVSVVCGKGS